MKILYQGSPGAYSNLAALEVYPDIKQQITRNAWDSAWCKPQHLESLYAENFALRRRYMRAQRDVNPKTWQRATEKDYTDQEFKSRCAANAPPDSMRPGGEFVRFFPLLFV